MNQGIRRGSNSLNVIVAVDGRWGIGRNGHLLFHIREDMKRFKALTTGHAIILGRKTLLTFPRGEPLPDRTNIVMTRCLDFLADPAVVAHSAAELADRLARLGNDAFVVGGTSVYEQLLPYCDLAFVTKVDAIVSAGSFFPNLDRLPGWRLIDEEEPVILASTVMGYDHPFMLSVRYCLYRQDHPRLLQDDFGGGGPG